MYEVYNSSIYNTFIKDLRKQRALTLPKLSEQIHMSLGTLSQLENDKDILNNGKLSVLLIFYGYDIEYLNEFDKELNFLMKKFITAILYTEYEEAKLVYSNLKNFFSFYKNTTLYSAFYLCFFIYNIFFTNIIEADKVLSQLTQDNTYSKPYTAILNLYIGRYYMNRLDYDKALSYLTLPIFNEIIDLNIIGFRNISLSSCYMRKKDIASAIKYCDEAITCFTTTNNYRRLLNTNINKGNQLLKIKDYQGALKINNEALNFAKKMNYPPEIRAFLNNNAYIYMMQNKYDLAINCFKEMPKSEMRDKHYCSYMISLSENKQYDLAQEISQQRIKSCIDPYLKRTFEVYHDFFIHQSLLKLNKDLITLLKDFKNSVDMFEIEFLHVLIAKHYKELNLYKNSMEYLEKLRELDS